MTTYQKVLNVYAMLRDWISSKASKYDIAPVFRDGTAYNEGDLVVHDDILYRCINYYAGGSWPQDYSQWFVSSTVADAVKALVESSTESMSEDLVGKHNISGTFSESKSYAVGDIVFYGDDIYSCKAAHQAGQWASSDFNKVTISELISSVENSMLEEIAKKEPISNGTFHHLVLYSGDSFDVGTLSDNALTTLLIDQYDDDCSITITLPLISQDQNGKFGAFRSKVAIVIPANMGEEDVPSIEIQKPDEYTKLYKYSSSGMFQLDSQSANVLDFQFLGINGQEINWAVSLTKFYVT